MTRSGRTELASSGALLRVLQEQANKTLPEPIIHIVLPLPPRGIQFQPPSSIKDPSYKWLKEFHDACMKSLSRFTLQSGGQVVLVEMRWVNTHDGREQYSSSDAPYGHSTHALAVAMDGLAAISKRSPEDWTVAWFDLQQGKGRSMGIQELRWRDFAGDSAESALRKLERVASHIKGFAIQEHRTVMFTFQRTGV
ncbi:MAG: hypothetical protein UX20_C0007G0039 [Candidatus Magasanikbacteria bacterium GW2011_GWC2_45_8]|uniref:Uncharacterized protein n=1 Tax=Candidatus Magasanikbacteria bacterium GW2011_GWC2_45_8 TaxID=1619050 RepID=A0A0G1N0A9_9BACT|nr:MAG: hypothetical protein UX20_C0007G0039 [Candidatus Magasanikbacteria bacterium GW2011_GWC2_45_8]HBW73853.1 hypothetical protein [Candidatus Magasanikbacteria bacterium]